MKRSIDTSPNSQEINVFPKAIGILEGFLSNRYDEEVLMQGDLRLLTEFLIWIKRDIFIPNVVGESHLVEIWEKVRGNENNLKLVLDGYNHLFLTLGEKGFSELLEVLIESHGSVIDNDSVMDDTFYDSLPTNEDLSSLLKVNQWAIIIYLIYYCNITTILKRMNLHGGEG